MEVVHIFLIFSLVTLSYQQCLTPTDSIRPISEEAAKALLKSELNFSMDLLHSVADVLPGENIFFSPSSVFRALVMSYFVSANHTESNIKKVLYLPADKDKLDILGAYTLQSYYERLRQIKSTKYTLTSANRVYYAKNLKVQPCMKLLFADELYPANFEENLKHVVKKVNHWVAENTRNVIKDFLSEDQLSRNSELILVNAAYFKGSWKHQFDEEDTKKKEFYLSNGTVVKTTIMAQQNAFKWGMNDKLSAEVLELPYEGDDISMFVLMPLKPSATAIQDLLKKLDTQTVQNIVSEFNLTTPNNMEVFMPKFTAEKSLDLTEILESMGLEDLFEETADLSTLTGSPGLSFSEALHKAKVRVDEVGTEAAAATGFISARMGVDSFIADHPFVYFVYDKAFHTVPFIGVYNYPE